MTRSANLLLFIGALLGGTAVALGAYSEHHLRPLISDTLYHSVGIAAQYQLLHAVRITALAGLALTMPASARRKRLHIAGWIIATGTLLFSGSIHLAAILDDDRYKQLAPMGGTLLMLGWAGIAWAACARAHLDVYRELV